MELRLSPAQESALRQVAETTGRAPEELVQEAVDQWLDYERWFREQVQIGLAQATRGARFAKSQSGSFAFFTQRESDATDRARPTMGRVSASLARDGY
jgi:predicted transcriptional regulator